MFDSTCCPVSESAPRFYGRGNGGSGRQATCLRPPTTKWQEQDANPNMWTPGIAPTNLASGSLRAKCQARGWGYADQSDSVSAPHDLGGKEQKQRNAVDHDSAPERPPRGRTWRTHTHRTDATWSLSLRGAETEERWGPGCGGGGFHLGRGENSGDWVHSNVHD